MGSGKSSVGNVLARQLGYAFVDSDSQIEATTGVDVTTIFDIEGEEGFRQREQRCLEDLAGRERIVVATGGGSILRPANRALMAENAAVIYLRASVDQILRRTRHCSNRPLLQQSNPRAVLDKLLAERGPLYESLADLTVDTDRCRVHAVARDALAQLRGHFSPGASCENT